MDTLALLSWHMKSGPPFLVPLNPNMLKYLEPQIIYFNLVEIFGLHGTKISDIFGPL